MIEFTFSRLDKRGTTKVVARNGSAASHTFRVDLQDPEGREKAIEQTLAAFPGLDRDDVNEALQAEAARDDAKTDKVADALLEHLRAPGVLELFHSPEGEAFALVRVDRGDGEPHHETLRIRSSPFKDWLAREAFVAGFRALTPQTVQIVTSTIMAEARFAAPEMPVFVRVGEKDGVVFLDLANDEREIVRIASDGWSILRAADAPVRMIKARGMLSLPRPERVDPENAHDRIVELRRFLNVDDEQWVLVRGFVLEMFRPRGPHAALVLTAEHGCGKTWTARVLRELVDPNVADNRRPPRDERDLAIAARNGRVISLNNLSGLSPWLSDALCCVLDGDGLATRELYSDTDETLFAGARPVILNGIEDVATRPDLADRAVHLALRRMEEANLKDEDELRAEFGAARPRILGAFLDAVACALRRVEYVRLERKPRRIDFARFVEAGGPALGLKPGEFLSVYMKNRAGASSAALESSPFALAIRDLVEDRGEWSGSMTELLDLLKTPQTERIHSWPTTARKAAAVLRTFAPSLRSCGVEVHEEGQDPTSRRTLHRFRKVRTQSFGRFEPIGDRAPRAEIDGKVDDPKDPNDAAPTPPNWTRASTWTDPGDDDGERWEGSDVPGMFSDERRKVNP